MPLCRCRWRAVVPFVPHHRFGAEVPLGHPPFHVGEFGVKFLELGGWIEHTEIRCRIASRSSRPLPSSNVAGQFEIQQVGGEVPLRRQSIKVLAEKQATTMRTRLCMKPVASNSHARTRDSLFGPLAFLNIIVPPRHLVVFGRKASVRLRGKACMMACRNPAKSIRSFFAVLEPQLGGLSNADGAKPQVHTDARRPNLEGTSRMSA